MTEVEEKIPLVTWDHHHIYYEGKPITDWVKVRLSARIEDDLQWEIPQTDQYILWELDLGLQEISLDDEQTFNTLKLAVQHFAKQIGKNSIGVVLYKGPLFNENLVHYLQLFAPYLPEDLPIVVEPDLTGMSLYEAAQLIHREHWEHFLLLPTPLPWASPFCGDEKVGLLFPENKIYKEAFEKKVEELNVPFRLLYENYAITEWDGLDTIILVDPYPSAKTERMIKGFQAAGGQILR